MKNCNVGSENQVHSRKIMQHLNTFWYSNYTKFIYFNHERDL
jgi:hypothetical protein